MRATMQQWLDALLVMGFTGRLSRSWDETTRSERYNVEGTAPDGEQYKVGYAVAEAQIRYAQRYDLETEVGRRLVSEIAGEQRRGGAQVIAELLARVEHLEHEVKNLRAMTAVGTGG